jgi:hypothetical protein
MFVPSMAGTWPFKNGGVGFERLGATPGACIEIMRLNSQIDVSAILPTIHIPTLVIHRQGDVAVNVEGGREIAALVPGARYIELPGTDHIPFIGDNAGEIVDAVREFRQGRPPSQSSRDRRWRDLLDEHDKAVRAELARFRGHEVKSLGDGFLATFDGPARAIHCAQSITTALRPLGIPIRAGIHTGEVEIAGHDIRGIAVHITHRRHPRLAYHQGYCSGLRHHVRRFRHTRSQGRARRLAALPRCRSGPRGRRVLTPSLIACSSRLV